MYENDKQRTAAIQESARKFDLYDQVGEAETAEFIESLSGDAEPPAEDVDGANGFDTVPLSGAIETARLAQVPAFQQIHAAIEELHAQAVAKSKDEKQSADYRALHHAKGLGIEQVLGVISAVLEESSERLKLATPAERRAMGSEANTFIRDLIEAPTEKPIADTRAGAPSAAVQSSTRRAQEWLKKN